MKRVVRRATNPSPHHPYSPSFRRFAPGFLALARNPVALRDRHCDADHLRALAPVKELERNVGLVAVVQGKLVADLRRAVGPSILRIDFADLITQRHAPGSGAPAGISELGDLDYAAVLVKEEEKRQSARLFVNPGDLTLADRSLRAAAKSGHSAAHRSAGAHAEPA